MQHRDKIICAAMSLIPATALQGTYMKNVHLISRKQHEKIVKTLNSANILTKMFRRQMDQFDSLIKSRL